MTPVAQILLYTLIIKASILSLKGHRMTKMTVFAKVRPEKRVEFLQAVGSLKDDCEKQIGLKKVTLCQEIDDQTACSLIYEWETKKDLERYLAAEKFRVLLGALQVLAEKSEIRYRQISEKLQGLVGGGCERPSELKTGAK